jgi:hypothetical protein
MVTSFRSLPNSALSSLCILQAVGSYLHEGLKRQDRYINFSAWLVKNVLFKGVKIKLLNERHVELKEIMCNVSMK